MSALSALAMLMLVGVPQGASAKRSGISICVKNLYAESIFALAISPLGGFTAVSDDEPPGFVGKRIGRGGVACYATRAKLNDRMFVQLETVSLGQRNNFSFVVEMDRPSGRLFISYGFDVATGEFSTSEPAWR